MSRLSPRVCTVLGPDTLQVGQRRHFTKLWTFWFATSGVRLARLPQVFEGSDVQGEPCEVFSDVVANHLTACFDQNSRPVVAIEKMDGNIEVRKFVGGVETIFVFDGRQPQLFYNWELLFYPGDSDVVCFYLKNDGRKIYARFQRDEFDTEYEFNVLHCEMGTLEETNSRSQLQYLYGRTIGGRVVTLISRLYPPFPAEADDSGNGSARFISGDHSIALITLGPLIDTSGQDSALLGGLYILKVKFSSGDDLAALTTALGSGDHSERLVLLDAGDDLAANTTKLLVGSYVLRVTPANAGLDKAVGTTAVDGGSYFKAIIDGGTRLDTGRQATDFLEGIHELV